MAVVTAKLENTDDIKVTLTLTRTIGEWKYIRRDLNQSTTSIPSDDLRFAIDELVQMVEEKITKDIKL